MIDLSHIFANSNLTTLVAAFIALAGVVLSAFISAIVSRRSNYINAVTAERSKWIDKLRNNISECLGSLGYLHFRISVDGDFVLAREYHELLRKNEILISTIMLQLNPNARIDKNIIALLNVLPHLAEGPDDRYRAAEELLIRHSQFLLKEEWEKVKYESRGLARLLSWPKTHLAILRLSTILRR